MNTLASLLILVLAVVCLGIPVTAVAVVCRDDLRTAGQRVRRALSFDPRHPALDYHVGR